MRQKKAFTLVELLVVIAIISVLAAMLLPALQHAMDSARKVDCANRMKQVFLFSGSYCNDFRLVAVPGRLCPLGTTQRYYGKELLIMGGYLENTYVRRTTVAERKTARWVNETVRPAWLLSCPASFYWGYLRPGETGSPFLQHSNGGGGLPEPFFKGRGHFYSHYSEDFLRADGYAFWRWNSSTEMSIFPSSYTLNSHTYRAINGAGTLTMPISSITDNAYKTSVEVSYSTRALWFESPHNEDNAHLSANYFGYQQDYYINGIDQNHPNYHAAYLLPHTQSSQANMVYFDGHIATFYRDWIDFYGTTATKSLLPFCF